MDGKELFTQIANLKQHIVKYLETKSSYYGMLIFEKAVRGLGFLLANVFILMAGLIGLLFLSGALAVYLGQVMDSMLYGLLVVAGLYFLLMVILVMARRRIFGRIAIRAVKNIFLDDDGEKKEPHA